MINDIRQDANQRMQKSVESLKQELTKLRTGRAHPSLIEHIKVDAYGSDMPLNQVSSISVGDARTLVVTVWDKNMIQAVEKAIMTADLGLNPQSAGTTIRIPLPPLTEERRKDLTKIVKQEGENTRVAIRNIRRDANQDVKELLKAKDITEDEMRGSEDAIQKLTDGFVKQVDELVQAKEQELLEI